jgi:hypothetical protein
MGFADQMSYHGIDQEDGITQFGYGTKSRNSNPPPRKSRNSGFDIRDFIQIPHNHTG